MLITIEKVLLLKQMSTFKNVSNMALSDLMAVSEEQICKPETVLIHADKPNKTVYFLLSGAVERQYKGLTEKIQAKAMLGLESAFWMGNAETQVTVIQKSVVLAITQDKLYRIIALHPSLAFAILNELSSIAH